MHNHLARQVRFRVDGAGPMSQRYLVPDTELTQRLMTSPAGPRLNAFLRSVLQEFDGESDRMLLKGLSFVPDAHSAAAMNLLIAGERKTPWHLGSVQESERSGQLAAESTSAWYNAGWTTFSPATARNILGAVGAFRPDRHDRAIRSTEVPLRFAQTALHELHHADSAQVAHSPQIEKLRWLEEGLATLLASDDRAVLRVLNASGITPDSYQSRIKQSARHGPDFDVGWTAWQPPVRPAEVTLGRQAVAQRNYGDSQVIVDRLLRASGTPRQTDPVGARQMLQHVPLEGLPAAFSRTIGSRHGLSRDQIQRLEQGIPDVINAPDALDHLLKGTGVLSSGVPI